MNIGHVIGLAGLPGAGKSELTSQLVLNGVDYFNGGEIVRAMADKSGFQPTDNNRDAYLPFWKQYADVLGDDWLSQMVLNAAAGRQKTVLMDGVRIPADAQAISSAPNGIMVWAHGELPVLARRVMQRGRVDDSSTFSTESEYIALMEKDLSNNGTFSMGLIRDLCDVHLLPIPEIDNTSERKNRYALLAQYILDIVAYIEE